MSLLEMRGITKRFHGVTALSDVNLAVRARAASETDLHRRPERHRQRHAGAVFVCTAGLNPVGELGLIRPRVTGDGR